MALLQSVSRRFMSKLQEFPSIHRRCYLSKAAAAFSTTATTAASDEDELKAMYEKYLIDFGKTDYMPPEEKEQRFELFKENLKFIQDYNSTHPFNKLGLTSVTDYSLHEICGLVIPPEEPLPPTNGDNLLPAYLKFPQQKHPPIVFKEGDRWEYYVPPEDEEENRAATASFSTTANASEDELQAMYEKYLIDFGKTDYMPPEEKEQRFELFKENLKFIQDYNSTHPFDKLGLTSVTDYFPHEICGLVIPPEEPLPPTNDNNLLPAYLKFPQQKHPPFVFKEGDRWEYYAPPPEDEEENRG
ncbi:putative actinidain [Helianthus annuus]|uniref:Actinidain n=1 Tax=Helianthus annuus TaxID=4232 RepID=A0A9K3IQ05_HELAN|nr:putative actinidain [Helianthus annuus]